MAEKAFLFGEPKILLGIVSEPPAVAPERPAIIILNAGLVYRVGPARKTVRLARGLAAAGFLTMRFDLSGIGDSEPRRDTLNFDDRANLDVRQAMDHLQRTRGIKTFLLAGLCSGADNSYRGALSDERVVGAVLIDTFGYQTPGYFLRYYGRRLTRPRVWGRLVRRVASRLAAGSSAKAGSVAEVSEAPQPQYLREFPPLASFRAGIKTLVDRGVRLNFFYTASMEAYYNYPGQLFDSLAGIDLRGLVTCQYSSEADHTFADLDNQRILVGQVTTWAKQNWGPPP